jgi:predicted dehydrogenase
VIQGDVINPKMDATEPLAREAEQFIECIRTGTKPISDGASGAQVVAVLEHGQRSLETGQPVAIPPLDTNAATTNWAA